jgi:hypothetical protein
MGEGGRLPVSVSMYPGTLRDAGARSFAGPAGGYLLRIGLAAALVRQRHFAILRLG